MIVPIRSDTKSLACLSIGGHFLISQRTEHLLAAQGSTGGGLRSRLPRLLDAACDLSDVRAAYKK